MIKIKNLDYMYGEQQVLDKVNIHSDNKNMIGIIGPNGAGKSTLLKCMAGILRIKNGGIYYDDRPIFSYRRKQIAKMIGYLPQKMFFRGNLTVMEIVMLGRYPFLSWKAGKKDLQAVQAVMENLGIQDLAARNITELSGGEKQMVFIAQTLVKEPKILLLDEPASHLDLSHQFRLFKFLKSITKKLNLTCFTVLHDINLASSCMESLVVLDNGKVFDSGNPNNVITSEMIECVYKIKTLIHRTSHDTPQMTFMSEDDDREETGYRQRIY